jgi:hypothetical protein
MFREFEHESLERVYSLFKNRLSLEDFKAKFDSLSGEKKWKFVRGSLLYHQALKCEKCEPNIAMLLLCSCADAMKVAGEDAGSRKNFKEFYMQYCPNELRTPPIEYYSDTKPKPQTAPFNKALDFIYAKFRNPYTHEAKAILEKPNKKLTGDFLLDEYKGEYYHADKLKFPEWFENITLESLSSFLRANAQQRDS